MKILIYVFIIITSIYALLCGLLYLFQDKLIFFPPRPVADVYHKLKQNEVSFISKSEILQGVRISGWKTDINPDASKTVIYFGGNAEDVVYFNYEAENLKIRQVFSFNHPGYGSSEGQASQKNLYQSALDAYDFVIEEYKLKPHEIIVIGRSLGSSVAAYLGANREISALILITPFDSIRNMAAARFKYFPVKYILKHSFYTIEHIKKIKSKVLILAAEQDEMIPRVHLQKLIEAAGTNTRFVKYQAVGHNTIQTHPEYYNEINRFISAAL